MMTGTNHCMRHGGRSHPFPVQCGKELLKRVIQRHSVIRTGNTHIVISVKRRLTGNIQLPGTGMESHLEEGYRGLAASQYVPPFQWSCLGLKSTYLPSFEEKCSFRRACQSTLLPMSMVPARKIFVKPSIPDAGNSPCGLSSYVTDSLRWPEHDITRETAMADKMR